MNDTIIRTDCAPSWYQRCRFPLESSDLAERMRDIARLQLNRLVHRDFVIVSAELDDHRIAHTYTRLQLRQEFGWKAFAPWQ